MALSDIAAVRLNVSDKPTLLREAWTADGETSEIRLASYPVQASPVPRIYRTSVLLATPADYTLDLATGVLSLVVTPLINVEFVFEYYATVFTDAEIQNFLDKGNGDTWLASAYTLLAMAVDAARIARRETLAGGGGFGATTIDTSVRAKELREQAKAFIDLYNTYGEGTNVAEEGITEVAWTEAMAERWVVRELLNNG